MSDLKHQDVDTLKRSKIACEKQIATLSSTLSGQHTRLEWINRYLFEKTPQEMSIKDIENTLGHKVIIKP